MFTEKARHRLKLILLLPALATGLPYVQKLSAQTAPSVSATPDAATPKPPEPAKPPPPGKDTPVQLDRLEVNAKREQSYDTIDRKTYNVGSDIQSAAGSASDLLQNIPSVQVDIDGNVSLRGSSDVLILIDGKPSTMMGRNRAEILQQLPADEIDKIEVITNPSAKYKPDGTAGIINIAMKKTHHRGFSGTATFNVGNDGRYNAGISANYHPARYNIFGSLNIRQDDRPRYARDLRLLVDPVSGAVTRADKQTVEGQRPFSYLARAGFDYAPNEHDQWGLNVSYNERSFERHATDTNVISDAEGLVGSEYYRRRFDPESQRNFESTASYRHEFAGKGHELSFELRSSEEKELEPNHYTNQYVVPPGLPDSRDNKLLTTISSSLEADLEYARPFQDGSRLESGYVYAADHLDAYFLSEDFDPETGQWVRNSGQSNHFIYDDWIHAFYATYARMFGKFGAQAGLRAELAHGQSHLVDTGEIIPDDYAQLYPTLHLRYQLTGEHELQLNYSRRIHRPDTDDLNPFPEFIDPFNLRAGNPLLRPEDIHSIEGGYQFKQEKNSFLATLYYRSVANAFTTVTRYVNSTTLLTTRENLATIQSGGLELAASTALGDAVSVGFSGNIYRNEIDASNLGFGSRQSTIAWDGKINASWSCAKNTLLQINANYSAKRLTPQGYRYPTSVVNLGLRHNLANRKTSFVLTVSDLFDSLHERTVIDTPLLHEEIMRRRSARIVYIGVIHAFGKPAKKQKDDLQFDNQL